MSKILDPRFHYVPAASTDIRKTFARARRELARKESERFKPLLPAQREVQESVTVTELRSRRKGRAA